MVGYRQVLVFIIPFCSKYALQARQSVRGGSNGSSNNHHEAANLAAGDIALLKAGDRVPADGRLLAATALEIDESSLTGESIPIDKVSRALVKPEAPLAERRNLAFMNTVVTR